jgi:hypothetical protein
VDFSVNKDFAVTKILEAFKVQIRTEFFNILNHPNFTPPLPFLDQAALRYSIRTARRAAEAVYSNAGDKAQNHSVCPEGDLVDQHCQR